IGIAIIITTSATLHANGKTDIQTSAQAAEALRPLAGIFAETIFALGIIGTGLLAIPVLLGIGLSFTPLNPLKALYWSAVVNGVLAPPVMVLLMLLARKQTVMG